MSRPPIRNAWASWALDTLERMTRTFVQGFLAVVTLDGLTDASRLPDSELGLGLQLATGALAGAYSLLTSFAAKPIGSPSSASLLPSSLDPPAPAADAAELEPDPLMQAGKVATFVRPRAATLPVGAPLSRLERLETELADVAGATDNVIERLLALEAGVDSTLEQEYAPSIRHRIGVALVELVEREQADSHDRLEAARMLLEFELETSPPAADSSC